MLRALSFALLHLQSKTNTTVWLVLRRHTTEMEETTYRCKKKKERTLVIFPPENYYFVLYTIRVAHFLKVQGCRVFPAMSCRLQRPRAPGCMTERERFLCNAPLTLWGRNFL